MNLKHLLINLVITIRMKGYKLIDLMEMNLFSRSITNKLCM